LAFRAQFHQLFAGEIDEGKAESLAYVCSQKVDHLICSADKIVFRVLGCLGKGEQGVSLEEVLRQCGLSRKLQREFGEEYRKQWTSYGVAEGLQGRAFKKK
jgi:hypothetical protein